MKQIVLVLCLIFIVISCEVKIVDFDSENQDDSIVTQPSEPGVNGVCMTTNRRPTWYWSAVANAKKYRYSFDEKNWTETKETSYTPERNLESSEYTLYVQAGNKKKWSKSSSHTIIIDSCHPAVHSIIPESGSSKVRVDDNIIITFNERLNPDEIGIVTLTYDNKESDIQVTYYHGNNAIIKINGHKVTVNPKDNFISGLTYSNIRISGFEDRAGNKMDSYYDICYKFTPGIK